jgi:CRISPR-associated protein Csx10
MLEVTVQPHQGLVIGGIAEVGVNKTSLPYVPGSTLRGALAAAWIREHGEPQAHPRRSEFIDLFEGEIRYGLLLQDGTGVVPLTVRRCKYPTEAECSTWCEDAAYAPEAIACPHCGGGVESGKGEVSGVLSRRVLRAALGDDGRAKDGYLYARYELARERAYQGTISGTHPWLEEKRTIWIGGRTTTSGRAAFHAVSAGHLPVPASRHPDGALVIRLTAPAILVDDAGRPTLDPVPELLRLLELPREALKKAQRWTRPQRVGGWHAASGLPKPTEIAVAMGSTVVLHLAETGNLARLRREGIGLRRTEGHGSLELNPAPWRPGTRETVPPQAVDGGPLADVRRLGLLDREREVRWLLGRGRQALVERERGRSHAVNDFFDERVAIHFSDEQADAVRRLFTAPDLPGALVLLQRRLEEVAER